MQQILTHARHSSKIRLFLCRKFCQKIPPPPPPRSTRSVQKKKINRKPNKNSSGFSREELARLEMEANGGSTRLTMNPLIWVLCVGTVAAVGAALTYSMRQLEMEQNEAAKTNIPDHLKDNARPPPPPGPPPMKLSKMN